MTRTGKLHSQVGQVGHVGRSGLFGLAGSVAVAAVASLLALSVSGCAAEEDVSAREAAYPVGYTPPAQLPAERAAGAPAPPPPPPAVAEGADGQDPSVAVGEDESSADGPAPSAGAAGADDYTDTDPAALTDFRTTLDPYGSWHEDPTYGTVWIPSSEVVGTDFTPYQTAGHWEYDDDYVWVSDYDWGWAPFHYGRWVYGGVGWEWIPGRTYAGAWVSWRYGVGEWGYVGWAPLSPLWCWRGGIAVGVGFVPYAPYAFVPSAHLFGPGLGNHLVRGAGIGPIASHTQPWTSPSAGRVAAHPSVGGPPPSALHLQAQSVVRATGATPGIAQARAFARPSSAVALGARSPHWSTASTASTASTGASARASFGGASRVPYAGGGGRGSYSLGQSGNYGQPSHFGGKLGGGFAGSAASAPPARFSQPSQPYTRGYTASAQPSFGRSPEAYRSSAPTFRSAAPSYHSFAGGSSGFHGGGGVPAFHGGGGGSGGGGFHGGGGGGHFGGGGGGGHGGGHR